MKRNILPFVFYFCLLGSKHGVLGEVQTVQEFVLSKYAGIWYQMYSSPSVNTRFLKNSVCVTAYYGPYNSTTVTVKNSQLFGSVKGTCMQITGWAYQPDVEEPGKLLVELKGSQKPSPYYIYKLGPEHLESEELYQYSVVSNPSKSNLFLLARDPAEFREKYEEDLLIWLDENGWNTDNNKPVETYQGEDCTYLSPEDECPVYVYAGKDGYIEKGPTRKKEPCM